MEWMACVPHVAYCFHAHGVQEVNRAEVQDDGSGEGRVSRFLAHLYDGDLLLFLKLRLPLLDRKRYHSIEKITIHRPHTCLGSSVL